MTLDLRRARALYLLRTGRGVKPIARELGIDWRIVQRVRDTHGIPPKRNGRAYPQALRQDALQRIAAGASRFTVSKQLGISRMTVRRWCEADGVAYTDHRRRAA